MNQISLEPSLPGIFNSLNSIEDIIKFIGTFSPDTDPQARENINMEYKEAHQKFSNTNEIGKDVSAFANSEGGLIFYGVKCDPSDPTKPQAITGLEVKNIDTFDRVVNSHIHYPIKGLQKKIIPIMTLKSCWYVPQSDEYPHQNSDGKYYMRSGSEIRHIASLLS